MSRVSKYNRKKTQWNIDTANLPFIKRVEAYERTGATPVTLKGLFLFDSDYGKGAAAITEDFIVAFPKRDTDNIANALDDVELVEAIKNDEIDIVINAREWKGKDIYTIELIDTLDDEYTKNNS